MGMTMAEWPQVVITMDAQAVAAMNRLAAALVSINPCVGRLAQDQQRVDRVLSEISQSLDVPIDDFRTDALAWCSTQVDTIERSLYGVLYRVQHGDPPPWVMRQ